MASFNKLSSIVLLIVLYSCQPEEAKVSPHFVPNANSPCMGLWQYEKVVINKEEFILANAEMIPGFIKASLGGNRAELDRRRRYFGDDGYYQLRWVDRGEYSLGNHGDSDWQPNVGTWRWLAENDSLIQNENQYYEQKYHVFISENKLVLSSLRVMSQDDLEPNRNLWRRGETVFYEEHFMRVGE